MSLIAAVSYGIGQGGYGLWIARVSRSPLTKSIGLIAYIMLSDLIVVCALGAVALAGSELRVGPDLAWVGRLAPVAALGLLALGLLGPRILPRLVGSGRFASLVSPWSEVGSASFVASLAVRLVNILLAIGVTWAAARAFGIDAPAGAFLSFLPIIYLVSALPINVGPFGAVQFAWLYFFEPYGEGEQILAFQVVFSTMLTVGWALRGLPFVSSVAREIELGGAEAAATEKTPEA